MLSRRRRVVPRQQRARLDLHYSVPPMGGAQSTKKHDIIRVLTSETTLDEEDVVIARVDDLEIGKRGEDETGQRSDSATASKRNGITIALDGVGNEMKLSNTSLKTILSDVSGVIESGSMAAVMGPSGAGKTTLLDLISQRKTEGIIHGRVLFDGVVPTLSAIKKYTAYVPQTEAFFGPATVYETVLFAAMIKLPGTSSKDIEQKFAMVEHVIDQMGLSKCRDTKVGNHVIRGISGGEQKRLAVASALCTSNPRAMFLDEPTSGLDSNMAAEVIKSLSRLNREDGRTLIVTIHQPSMHVFQHFTKLCLLQDGKLAYFGKAGHNPMEFFVAQGFPYEPGFNIAEYFIDTISVSDHGCTAYYQSSALGRENLAKVAEITSLNLPMNAVTINTESSANGKGKDSPYAHDSLTELRIMLRFKDAPRWRDGMFWFTRLGLYSILACLLSAFFYQQKHTPSGLLNINGIAFIAIILPTFMAQVHVEELKFERELYTRHFHDSYYRPSNFIASKIIGELPMTVITAVSFSSILHWAVGFNSEPEAFFFFCLVNFVTFTIAQLIGCTVSATLPGDVGPASVLPMFSTLNMLVGGFFIRASTIHDAWQWLYRVSFIQWAWSAVMVNEYTNGDGTPRQFYDHCGSPTGGLDELIEQISLPESSLRLLRLFFTRQTECDPISGDSVLRTFSLEDRNRWMSLLYASISIPVYLITFYFGVSRVRHEKR